jgi:hypothetical protein
MNLDEAVSPLLNAPTRMQSVQRHLHPVHLDQLKKGRRIGGAAAGRIGQIRKD